MLASSVMTTRAEKASGTPANELPARWPAMYAWFVWYARRYIPRHMAAIRVLRENVPPVVDGDESLIVVMNHAAWWDPLVALVLADEYFPDLVGYSPIDAAALKKYRFFERLGFFGVERGTRAGTRRFLDVANRVLTKPGNALWITVQGEFVDARARPVEARNGVAHAALDAIRNGAKLRIVPLAIEYTFWQESRAEVLIAFGEPMNPTHDDYESPRDLSEAISRQLERTQDRLAAASIARREPAFDILLQGRVGIGGVYDLYRRWRSWLKREPFDPSHRGARS